MNSDFLLRIKDVSLCLLSANRFNIEVGRLEMQKIIYLIDNMSAYLFILSGRKGHQTYYYGPYDKNIQNALDALTIRDIAHMKKINIINKNISCAYGLTESGLQWSEGLLKNSKSIAYRFQIVNGIMYSLVNRNLLSAVKELVYAEPVYVETKVHGNHYDLAIAAENSGHNYLSLIEYYLKENENGIDIEFATDMYIDYLSTRNQLLSGKAHIGG